MPEKSIVNTTMTSLGPTTAMMGFLSRRDVIDRNLRPKRLLVNVSICPEADGVYHHHGPFGPFVFQYGGAILSCSAAFYYYRAKPDSNRTFQSSRGIAPALAPKSMLSLKTACLARVRSPGMDVKTVCLVASLCSLYRRNGCGGAIGRRSEQGPPQYL